MIAFLGDPYLSPYMVAFGYAIFGLMFAKFYIDETNSVGFRYFVTTALVFLLWPLIVLFFIGLSFYVFFWEGFIEKGIPSKKDSLK